MVMTVSKKIILVSSASVALSTAVALVVQSQTIRSQGIELTRNTMRAAVIEAENVRASIASLRARNAFDEAAILQEAKTASDFRQTRLYDTVPVVAAWKSIEKVARQEGFEFRVPKRHARNSQNEPNPAEAAILDVLEKTGQDEYFMADRAANLIVYARPIRLTADCLSCHGDPGNSATHDGKDALGIPMEGWREGEVHGAFVLTAHMDQVDHVASARAQSAAMRTTLLWMLPTGLIIGLGFFWYGRKSIVQPLLEVVRSTQRASVRNLRRFPPDRRGVAEPGAKRHRTGGIRGRDSRLPGERYRGNPAHRRRRPASQGAGRRNQFRRRTRRRRYEANGRGHGRDPGGDPERLQDRQDHR